MHPSRLKNSNASSVKEGDVQKAIVAFLDRMRIDYNRVNGAAMKFSGKNKRGNLSNRMVRCNSITGKADLELWCHIENGDSKICIPVYLEVKRPKGGSQSSDQKKFQSMIEGHGGYYFIVRSIEETMIALSSTKKDIEQKALGWKFIAGRVLWSL
jgi:hypothetical protein